jgi:hypothetical protein
LPAPSTANFELLLSDASPRWRRWSGLLVRALRSLQVRTADGSQILMRTTGGEGVTLALSRTIPEWQLVRTGAAGLPARDPTTGKWGKATVTRYKTTAGAVDEYFEVLDTITTTAFNKTRVAVPANTDTEVIEQGGLLMYIGHICP